MGTYRVIDTSSGPTKTYMGIVFRRTARVKKQVSLFQWVWLTVIEIIVGSELIESIVTTGSVQPHSNIIKEDSGKYGAELHLNLHIPAGFVMNALRRHLLQVLYYKFHWQYLILDQVGETHIDDNVCTINCTRTRFRAQKNLFYQFIALVMPPKISGPQK